MSSTAQEAPVYSRLQLVHSTSKSQPGHRSHPALYQVSLSLAIASPSSVPRESQSWFPSSSVPGESQPLLSPSSVPVKDGNVSFLRCTFLLWMTMWLKSHTNITYPWATVFGSITVFRAKTVVIVINIVWPFNTCMECNGYIAHAIPLVPKGILYMIYCGSIFMRNLRVK